MKNKQKIYISTNIICGMFGLTSLIYFWTHYLIKILNGNDITDHSGFVMISFGVAISCSIFLLLLIFINIDLFGEINSDISKIILSVITLQIPAVIYYSVNFTKVGNKWKLKPINIHDITLIAVFLSLYLVFDFVSGLIPPLPFFITISIKFIPLYFAAYIFDILRMLLLTVLCGLLSFFMPGNADAGNFAAYIFDYFVPVVAISLASLVKPKDNDKKISLSIQWFVFITIPIILIYFSRILAGVLFWFSGTWDQFGVWEFSIVYNFFNTAFDYILLLLTVPFICNTLKIVKYRYLK